MFQMPRRSRTNGFTLIELLVVIAIIAILAAILFPVFAQAREKARSITCVSNIKQVMLGELMYVQDYDETHSWTWGWATDWKPWHQQIAPYLAYSLMKIVAKYVNKYDMQFKVIHYNIERILQYIFKSILVMKER
jgi:prepilin-type N-terminal cleavage/methylation domain-containing protein